MTTTIAIIPARGGSKRIPGKNIKKFAGKPIIAYSIECALKTRLFDEVIVSTDDRRIANIAQKLGANVPFLRSKKTSNDRSSLESVLLEVIKRLEKQGKKYDYICCILPTAPFIESKKIIEGFDMITKGDVDAVLSVVKFDYPVQRAFVKNKDGIVSMLWPENMIKRSQDLPDSFHDAGQFYWLKTDNFLKEKQLFANNSYGLELSSWQVQDIDTLEDWKTAEKKFKLGKKL
jgi:pseudaminic acid cytidylyltransferase